MAEPKGEMESQVSSLADFAVDSAHKEGSSCNVAKWVTTESPGTPPYPWEGRFSESFT